MEIVLVVGISIFIGIFVGSSVVYVFNHIHAKWLCDYDTEPETEEFYTQRIKGYPWKYVFSATFIVIGIYLGLYDWQYAIAGVVAIWLLIEIAIADIKYMIIPDQFVILLAITAFGFIPFHNDYFDILRGLLLGFGAMLVIGIIGKLLFKKDAMGFGDVKLCASIGAVLGLKGAAFVIISSSFLSGIVAAIGLIRKKYKKDDVKPFGPYLAGMTIIYILLSIEM